VVGASSPHRRARASNSSNRRLTACDIRRLRLPLLLTLLLLLFLFLFGQVMPHGAAGRRTDDAVMTSHVSGYSPYNGALDATFRLGAVRADHEHKTQQGWGKHLHLHCDTPRHTLTPSFWFSDRDMLRTPQFV